VLIIDYIGFEHHVNVLLVSTFQNIFSVFNLLPTSIFSDDDLTREKFTELKPITQSLPNLVFFSSLTTTYLQIQRCSEF
jgi:hypothetical protein